MPKTAELEPLTSDDVFASGFSDVGTKGGGDVYAYRGDAAKKNLAGVPKGKLWICNKGLIFVTLGTTDRKEAVVDSIQNALSQIAPPLGLLTLARNLFTTSESFRALIHHPDSFTLPYSDIIEARIETTGGLFRKQNFLALTRQKPDDSTETFWLAPVNEPGFPRIIMTLRFMDEHSRLFWKYLCEETASESYLPQMQEEFRRLYPDGATPTQQKEFGEAITNKMAERLKAKGLGTNTLQRRAIARLAHFAVVSPDIADGVRAAQAE